MTCYPSWERQTCQDPSPHSPSQWATIPKSFRLSPVTSPLKNSSVSNFRCLFSSTSLLLSPCLSLSHFASSSLQCASLAPAQQLLFSDRSVKQKMMLGIKNRSWSKAQPPCSRKLLFCISSETSGIHSEVIICYSGAPCLSGTDDEVTSERATNEREIICYQSILDNHRLVGLCRETLIYKSHFLSLLICSCKTGLLGLWAYVFFNSIQFIWCKDSWIYAYC